MRIIGLDLGDKTIGVATSDESGYISMPLTVIQRVKLKEDINCIIGLVEEHKPGLIIVGFPYMMDGKRGRQCEKVEGFIASLKSTLSLPILTWDERLSTKAARRILDETSMSRGKKKRVVDKMAAAVMLQGYLDYRRQKSEFNPPISPFYKGGDRGEWGD